MGMKNVFIGVLACLQLVLGLLGDASANYTDMMLSSGAIQLGDWKPAYEKAAALVKTLTTAQKLSIIASGSGGNFTAIQMLDSAVNPLGYYYATTWPAGLAMAMTWDRQASHDQGLALGKEFKGKGIHMALAPTMQPLGRSPWCGRTGETYGVDSYTSGAIGGRFIAGLADAGVQPSAKHFILNEYETNRMDSSSSGGGNGGGGGGGGGGGMSPPPNHKFRRADTSTTLGNSTSSASYSVNIDDKAFHETYLTPFYDSIKNGAAGAMCAMNRVNDTYSCESQDLLGKYLKVEIGFPGLVSADVGAQKTGINAANAGMDLSSSSNLWSNQTLGVGISNGSFTEARLDDMVIRNTIGFFKYGQDSGFPAHVATTDYVDNRGNHSHLARAYASNSIALVKNKNNALPLNAKNLRSASIFGAHAGPKFVGATGALSVYNGVGPTDLGHMYGVGGSAMGTPAFMRAPVDTWNQRAADNSMTLRWWLQDEPLVSTAGMHSGNMIAESTSGVALNSQACVVYLNSWAGEGADRLELTNGTQDNLVNAVADICNNTIVVINTVGPRLVDLWIEHENVTGVLYGGPLGQESAAALDSVLFGDVNPSGKLVHTIGKNESDYDQNTKVSQSRELEFTEGNYIDYKYFDKFNITPRFEFGFGLSYTTFNYSSSITVSANTSALEAEYAAGPRAIGGRTDLWETVANVSGQLSNTGPIAGSEVAQLYVQFPEAADEPVRQIRGFEKVGLEAGETKDVSFELLRRDLSIWDVVAQEWKIERGEYTFFYGASSREFKASATLSI